MFLISIGNPPDSTLSFLVSQIQGKEKKHKIRGYLITLYMSMKEENMPLGITLSNRTKNHFCFMYTAVPFSNVAWPIMYLRMVSNLPFFLTNSIEQTQTEAYKCLKTFYLKWKLFLKVTLQ